MEAWVNISWMEWKQRAHKQNQTLTSGYNGGHDEEHRRRKFPINGTGQSVRKQRFLTRASRSTLVAAYLASEGRNPRRICKLSHSFHTVWSLAIMASPHPALPADSEQLDEMDRLGKSAFMKVRQPQCKSPDLARANGIRNSQITD